MTTPPSPVRAAPASPLVSICVPAYMGATHLPMTIESVLAQSFTDFALVIIDDASRDDTAEVVGRYRDPRITFLRNEINLGPQENWNRCLEHARGTYYKLLPQDDLLAPGALAEQVAVLEADRDQSIGIVFGSRLIIDGNGRSMFRRRPALFRRGRIDGRRLIRACIVSGTNLVGEPGNGLMRRSLATRLGSYVAEHPYMVDLDYWFRGLAHADGYYTGTQSSCFRISSGSWSVALARKQFDDFKGFVRKCAARREYGITRDVAIGVAKARVNSLGRALIYRSVLGGKTFRSKIVRDGVVNAAPGAVGGRTSE